MCVRCCNFISCEQVVALELLFFSKKLKFYLETKQLFLGSRDCDKFLGPNFKSNYNNFDPKHF